MLKKYSSLCLFCSSHISSDTNTITADVTLKKLIGLCITRVTLFDSRSMVFLRAGHLVVNNRMKALETRNRTGQEEHNIVCILSQSDGALVQDHAVNIRHSPVWSAFLSESSVDSMPASDVP